MCLISVSLCIYTVSFLFTVCPHVCLTHHGLYPCLHIRSSSRNSNWIVASETCGSVACSLYVSNVNILSVGTLMMRREPIRRVLCVCVCCHSERPGDPLSCCQGHNILSPEGGIVLQRTNRSDITQAPGALAKLFLDKEISRKLVTHSMCCVGRLIWFIVTNHGYLAILPIR